MLTEQALAQVTWDWGRGTSYRDAELYRTGTVSGKVACVGQPVPREKWRGGGRSGKVLLTKGDAGIMHMGRAASS